MIRFSTIMGVARFLTICFVLLLTPLVSEAQTCSCTEYIYLNEPATGVVHKYRIESGTALTEVIGGNGGTTWYPGNTTSQFPSPHGIATDLNGRLYIGATGGGPLYRLNCDGVLDPSYAPLNTQGASQSIFSIGNTIYANGNGIRAFNSCTGTQLGEMCYKNINGLTTVQDPLDWAWGISYNKNTQMVYATGRKGTDYPGKTVWAFTRSQLEAGIAGGPCIDPLVNQSANATVNVGEKLTPAWDGSDIGGVTSDNSGNFYVVIGFEIYKYDASGGFLAKGYNQAKLSSPIGAVWSESNRLYVSNYSDADTEDCIAVFDATTMAYLGTGIPNPATGTNNTAKAIGILKECCPTNLPAAFTKNVCGEVGKKFYLNEEAFSSCDGIVCGSSWVAQGALSGMTFDACDNSVTITGNGCGVFSLNTGAVISTGCPAQSSTFTICNTLPPAITVTTQSTCTPNGNYTLTGTISVAGGAPTTGTLTVSVPGGGSQVINAPFASTINFSIPNMNALGLIRTVYAEFSANNCSKEANYTEPTTCPTCISALPTSVNLSQTAPTCTGSTENNNGKITLTSAADADKFGISALGASSYDGPAYVSATAYAANTDVITAIPNTGGAYIVRLFNGSAVCYTDTIVTVAPVMCAAPCPVPNCSTQVTVQKN